MLKQELIFYLSGSFFIALFGSTVASVIVCKRLDEVNHCISFSFPWLFLMAFIILLIIIYFIFSLYASNELYRTDIIEALKE
jgi:putative ABC transport system permease protein